MGAFVCFFEAFYADVGVDLRGGQGGMPQHVRNGREIGSVVEQVRGE